MSGDQEKIRIAILKKIDENPQRRYCTIAKAIGVSRQTVSNVVKQFNETKSVQRKQSMSKKKGPNDKDLEKKVIGTMKKKRGMPIRDVAKKCDTNHEMVQRIKKRNNMKCYKKQKIPKRSEKQVETGKMRAKKLFNLLNEKKVCVVMDD